MAKGLTVGTYTSPNLHAVAERLARNAEPIDDESLTAVLTELALLEPLLAERPTRFELLTAAALSWFAAEAVDAMVVEVGLGGTWDSTNVVHGDVAVLTNVSFDHTDVLGPTLEGIAADKAGIIEPGSRVVVGEMAPDLVAIVEARAARGRRRLGLGGRAGLRLRDEPGGGGRAPGHAVDARRPLRGCPGPSARRPPGRQCRRRAGRGRGVLRSSAGGRRGGGGLGGRAGARASRGAGPPPAAARRRRAQRGGHGRAGDSP